MESVVCSKTVVIGSFMCSAAYDLDFYISAGEQIMKCLH